MEVVQDNLTGGKKKCERRLGGLKVHTNSPEFISQPAYVLITSKGQNKATQLANHFLVLSLGGSSIRFIISFS